MEENDNGSMTVFVPSSPAITVGTVYIVKRSRVTILETYYFGNEVDRQSDHL